MYRSFLEDMVSRLSHELSSRLGDAEAVRSSLHSTLLEGVRGSALPPWMKDSRCVQHSCLRVAS
jgi:hypothetical protein